MLLSSPIQIVADVSSYVSYPLSAAPPYSFANFEYEPATGIAFVLLPNNHALWVVPANGDPAYLSGFTSTACSGLLQMAFNPSNRYL
jgi:hypothetical protein